MPGRDPETVRSEGNALQHEGSLYLRQHAHNPVDWMPWGEAAHSRAREQDKLIFLSIGYSSCHWCHVMEREAFADEELARLLNDHFVPIKVDREERPDVDKVYMEAVQALTGTGGWPLSVFLTPDLVPIFGATYLPADKFRQLLTQIEQAWRENNAEIAEQAQQIRSGLEPRFGSFAPSTVTPELLEGAGKQIVEGMDREQGGLATPMKFPVPLRWRYLLHLFRKSGELELAAPLRRTLDAMVRGGLMDQLAGGWHRYTVDASWTVPHFEKMLYDNAQLASLYLEAGEVFDEPDYRRAARRALDFLLAQMQDPEGGFYASFDADSEGVEGRYYVWTTEELDEALEPELAAAAKAAFGIDEAGNFEGSSVLTRRLETAELAARLGLDEKQALERMQRAGEALLERRAGRVAPVLDRKLVTAWNGYAICALARAARVGGEPRYAEAALRAGARLWELHVDEQAERVARASNEGQLAGGGILDDYASLGLAAVELYQLEGDSLWLQRALRLGDWIDRQFRRAEGGFFQTAADQPTPLARPVELLDSVEPSGVAQTLELKLRLAGLLGDPARARELQAELEHFGSLLERAGGEMAAWLDVALLAAGPLHELVLLGPRGELYEEARQGAAPWLLLHPLADAESHAAAGRISDSVADKEFPASGERAYVCQFGVCQAPTESAQELRAQLGAGWQR